MPTGKLPGAEKSKNSLGHHKTIGTNAEKEKRIKILEEKIRKGKKPPIETNMTRQTPWKHNIFLWIREYSCVKKSVKQGTNHFALAAKPFSN